MPLQALTPPGSHTTTKDLLSFIKTPQNQAPRSPLSPESLADPVFKQEEYTQALNKFNSQSFGLQVIPKGNAMTQKFYAKEILPQYIDQIKASRSSLSALYSVPGGWDPSYGNRSKNNLPAWLKRDTDFKVLTHPPQSPDLNPIEAIWQIIKSRLRGGKWQTVAEFKAAIQREWDRITLAQIQKRIREMPKSD
jgi:hypothetical protein